MEKINSFYEKLNVLPVIDQLQYLIGQKSIHYYKIDYTAFIDLKNLETFKINSNKISNDTIKRFKQLLNLIVDSLKH